MWSLPPEMGAQAAPAIRTALIPTVVYIYGGGFEFGNTKSAPGEAIVERSIELGSPIVYVSMVRHSRTES